MTVLADSSVWIEFLRRGEGVEAEAFRGLLRRGELVVCGPVVAELLTGTPGEQRFDLWKRLAGLPWANLGRDEWRLVGEVSAQLHEAGSTVPLTDIEIAVAAQSLDAALWTKDADFDRIASALSGLRRFEP